VWSELNLNRIRAEAMMKAKMNIDKIRIMIIVIFKLVIKIRGSKWTTVPRSNHSLMTVTTEIHNNLRRKRAPVTQTHMVKMMTLRKKAKYCS